MFQLSGFYSRFILEDTCDATLPGSGVGRLYHEQALLELPWCSLITPVQDGY